MKSLKKRTKNTTKVRPVKPITAAEHEYWENLLISEGFKVDEQFRDDGIHTNQSIQRKGRTNQNLYTIRHESEQYFRVIGIYIHNATLKPFEVKYVELLKEYSNIGNLSECCKKFGFPQQTLNSYLHRHFHKMLMFVNNLEIEESEFQYDPRN